MSLRRLLLVVAAIAMLALPAGASGHAALITTSPAIGAIVKSAPSEVALTFSEDINTVGAHVQVIGPDGRRYDQGSPTTAGRVLRQALKPNLPQGTSTVAWTVISADGHRVTNAFLFSVGRESANGGTVADAGTVAGFQRPAGSSTVMALSRALRFAGIILLLGLLAIVALVWDPTVRRGRVEDATTATAADGAFRPVARAIARVASPVLALIAVVSIPLEAWADGIGVRDVVDLRQGQIAAVQVVLALIAWPLLVRAVRYGTRRDVALAGIPLVLLALTPGLGGHAGAQSTAWLSVLVDWVHVLAAGVWGGGVIVLAATIPSVFRVTTATTRAPLLRGLTRRFTRLALGSLAALVLTGAIAAVVLSGSITDLPTTSWGRVLIAKVAVVVAAVLVAGIVRRSSASFSRAVQVEALLIVVAIALTGTLTGLSPQEPTSAAASAVTTGPFTMTRKVDAREAQIDITPATVGTLSEVHVIVTNGVGQPALDVKDASVVLVQGSDTKVPTELSPVGTAHWTGTIRIPKPGSWKVIVRLRIGEFREVVLAGTLTAGT